MKRIQTYQQYSLVSEGTFVDYVKKGLISLPKLPEDLEELYCYNNQLSQLPKLPKNLRLLYCSHNRLTSLPKLPDSLRGLYMGDNSLVNLPELPLNLVELYCYNNQLSQLPELPYSMRKLVCHHNQLTWIHKLPKNLMVLNCSHNPLECLIPEKFYGHQELDWFKEYLQKIQTYFFQKNLLTKDPNQIQELMKRNILNDKIRQEFSDLVGSVEWGLL